MSKRRGRPPLDPDDHSVDVHLKMPAQQYDATYRQARLERMTLSDVIRDAIRVRLQHGRVTGQVTPREDEE